MSLITEDFLLNSKVAKILYHEYAVSMPIFDYHCHLDIAEVHANKNYANIFEMWLSADHYKWRAMRLFGIDEEYITGKAEPFEKFKAWLRVLDVAIGNPLLHWSYLEMKRYFDVNEELCEANAQLLWDSINKKLANDNLKPQAIIKKFNVKLIGTTDDPLDDLELHKNLLKSGMECKILPSFRPDKFFAINGSAWLQDIHNLAKVAGMSINHLDDFINAMFARVDYFHSVGCKVNDNGIDDIFYCDYTEEEVKNIFKQKLDNPQVALSNMQAEQFKTYLFLKLAQKYHSLEWVMQMHIGPMRNNNSKMLKSLGFNAGFDSMGEVPSVAKVSRLLDNLDKINKLPKTVIYNIHPALNGAFATMMGNFTEKGVSSKVHFGSGWWFLDQKLGMEEQIATFANMGILATFIGMVTDSRSILSYTRHEYFRRIMCNLIGKWAENGEVLTNMNKLGKIVQDIAYNNAKNYFKII